MTTTPTLESELEAAIRTLEDKIARDAHRTILVIHREIRLVLTALAEDRKDRERFDWFVQNGYAYCLQIQPSGKQFNGDNNLRSAIDAARCASSQTEGDK